MESTITFTCPNCDKEYVAGSGLAGKKVRCTNCGHQFVAKRASQVQAVEEDDYEDGPLPFFYEAALVHSWKMFAKAAHVKSLVFVFAAITFKFFLLGMDYSATMPGFRIQLPLGQITTIICFGCVFWYFMRTVEETAFGADDMPDSDDIDSGFAFLWNVIKSNYMFLGAFILSELPFILVLSAMINSPIPTPGFVRILFVLGGLALLPIVLLTIVAGVDIWMVLLPKNIVTPIIKAPLPYLLVAGMLIATFLVQLLTKNHCQITNPTALKISFHLLTNYADTVMALITMRAIGLFGRHYSCYLPQM